MLKYTVGVYGPKGSGKSAYLRRLQNDEFIPNDPDPLTRATMTLALPDGRLAQFKLYEIADHREVKLDYAIVLFKDYDQYQRAVHICSLLTAKGSHVVLCGAGGATWGSPCRVLHLSSLMGQNIFMPLRKILTESGVRVDKDEDLTRVPFIHIEVVGPAADKFRDLCKQQIPDGIILLHGKRPCQVVLMHNAPHVVVVYESQAGGLSAEYKAMAEVETVRARTAGVVGSLTLVRIGGVPVTPMFQPASGTEAAIAAPDPTAEEVLTPVLVRVLPPPPPTPPVLIDDLVRRLEQLEAKVATIGLGVGVSPTEDFVQIDHASAPRPLP